MFDFLALAECLLLRILMSIDVQWLVNVSIEKTVLVLKMLCS